MYENKMKKDQSKTTINNSSAKQCLDCTADGTEAKLEWRGLELEI